MAFPDLSERLAEVRGRIAAAAQRGGHRQDCRIVAVTKTHGPDAVEAAWAAGITDVGENKVQEAVGKLDALAEAPCTRGGLRWHLIGHLQRNKAGRALDLFDRVHGVDSAELAEALSRRAAAAGRRLPVLVEVNVSGEASKFGVAPDTAVGLLERVASLPGLALEGLMTVGPPVARAAA